MKQLRIEPLSRKFSIVKDHLWCIYDGEQPLFHGSANDCRDWLDRHDAMSLDLETSSADQLPTDRPMTFWDRLVRITFRSSRTV